PRSKHWSQQPTTGAPDSFPSHLEGEGRCVCTFLCASVRLDVFVCLRTQVANGASYRQVVRAHHPQALCNLRNPPFNLGRSHPQRLKCGKFDNVAPSLVWGQSITRRGCPSLGNLGPCYVGCLFNH
ncbi:unnamed protein product, partial [Ectocarpus sp. 13 AM-2016]